MAREFPVTWQRFASAEAGTLGGGYGTPCIVLAFGGEPGPALQLALSLDDARDLAAEVVAALADHGDGRARAIAEQFFLGGEGSDG